VRHRPRAGYGDGDYSKCKFYTNFEKMLADAPPDAVTVARPTACT
jgi:predicted dehydrogenase